MPGGPVQVYSASVASGISLTSAFVLGKSFNKISLVIPTMASGSDLQIMAAEGSGAAYRTFFHQPTVTSGTVSFVIASTVTQCIIPLPNLHADFLKVRLTTATTDTPYTYVLICSD